MRKKSVSSSELGQDSEELTEEPELCSEFQSFRSTTDNTKDLSFEAQQKSKCTEPVFEFGSRSIEQMGTLWHSVAGVNRAISPLGSKSERDKSCSHK